MSSRLLRALRPGRPLEVLRAARRFSNWGALLRAYLGAGRYPMTLRFRGGGEVVLTEPHDAATAWVVYCREEYRVPSDAACILDIGANWGAFTIFAAMRAPAARIVSVEPHPEVYPRLRAHVHALGLDARVHTTAVGVASAAGERRMDADPAHPGPSRGFVAREVDSGMDVVVKVTTLDAQIREALAVTGAERIDLLKMDVEGAEHECLPGLDPNVLRRVDRWVMEYHPNGPREVVFGVLEAAGLRLVHDAPAGRDSGVAHFSRLGNR